MQLVSKYNKGIRFLCIVDIYDAWVVSSNDKKGVTITNALQTVLSLDANQIKYG